jgi:hypothetical protein
MHAALDCLPTGTLMHCKCVTAGLSRTIVVAVLLRESLLYNVNLSKTIGFGTH